VIGSGYVGLVAGACFSDTGNDVSVVDIAADRIERLKRGELPMYEPGLKEMVDRNVEQGRLSFTTDLAGATAAAQVVILAVDTPSTLDGAVDMRQMDAAAAQVGAALSGYTVIVTKSTVPVGTHKRVCQIIASATEAEFDYVANPEFLKEGSAVADFVRPDRIVVGLTSDRALRTIRHLYAPFRWRTEKLLVMDPASAELTKYACNAMLALVNELARLCDHFGADIAQVRRGVGADRRIGPDFLYPSLGYGGSCLPKDIKALISMSRAANHPARIAEAAHLANQEQRESMFSRISHYFGGKLGDKKIAVWGLAFKARTDDVRDSPAITVVQRLLGAGAAVAVHDPKALENARRLLGDKQVQYCQRMYDALDGANALLICTEWQQYRTPDFERMRSLLADPVIFDGRNLYELDWIAGVGMDYFSIGRPPVLCRPG